MREVSRRFYLFIYLEGGYCGSVTFAPLYYSPRVCFFFFVVCVCVCVLFFFFFFFSLSVLHNHSEKKLNKSLSLSLSLSLSVSLSVLQLPVTASRLLMTVIKNGLHFRWPYKRTIGQGHILHVQSEVKMQHE